jgi:hypothetical protein
MHASSRRELTTTIESFLSDLGDNATDVADCLRRERVQGLPRHSTKCAVAKYLNAVVGTEQQVQTLSVGNNKLLVRGPRWWSGRLRIELPVAVRQFIAAFDRYAYPDLVLAPAEVGSGAGGGNADASLSTPG